MPHFIKILDFDTNVKDWYKCKGWIQMSFIHGYQCWGCTQVGFDCWSNFDQMLRIDTNVRVGFKWDLFMDVNVEDVHRLDLIVSLKKLYRAKVRL